MFTSLYFENYKSFKMMELNLEQAQLPKRIVAIYGENGSGKSNIISALIKLEQSVSTRTTQHRLTELQAKLATVADDSPKKTAKLMDFMNYRSLGQDELSAIFKDTYRRGASGPMVIRYNFKLDQNDGWYELKFTQNQDGLHLVSETLHYLIKSATGINFKITGDEQGHIKPYWSPSLFKGNMKDIAEDATDRFWGKHTFLAILTELMRESNQNYVRKNVADPVIAVNRSFHQLAFKSDHTMGVNPISGLLPDLQGGTLPATSRNAEKIKLTQAALNQYFVPLYSDMVQVFYQTDRHQGDLEYRLFEKKRISGQITELPFRLESHGTKQLLKLFPLFLDVVKGDTVIIDEIDNGVHDLLIDRLIENVRDDIQGQLIFTTHDTQIMKQLEASALYVIQTDTDGNKQVINLSKNGKVNIAANNNVQKMYLDGYFAGIPYSDDVDFYAILNDLEVD
ncbi:ATP-binding protein [Levilactobacillus namurensis]|uniref:AAA family ATPase n=2 Tax=Levilactobacillus namurensis TaxID=380393 RepID=UPI002230592B|nr:ATP-binding protein [Levilactobacillus namurensis]MCW3779446.1 ATP-binding protein [Levilactobacillus namurensis]MDT7018169.1 ATP-binding protein [Levilactobacillus namurensis]WNN64844.1 ATP-binding protein [Levilactobacillus namurensis]